MISKEIVMNTLHCPMGQYPSGLEAKFPHILEKVVALWDSSEMGEYLADLLQPNGRSGGRVDRDGFPDNVWQEIFQIKQLYELPQNHKKRMNGR
jgi:hypothetical protein